MMPKLGIQTHDNRTAIIQIHLTSSMPSTLGQHSWALESLNKFWGVL